MTRSERDAHVQHIAELLAHLTPRDYQIVLDAARMQRRWRPKHIGWTNVLDQLLHAAYGAVVFAPLVIWWSWWAAAVSGFLLGAAREVEQFRNWDLRIPMLGDRVQDALFFAVGAVLLYVVVRLL